VVKKDTNDDSYSKNQKISHKATMYWFVHAFLFKLHTLHKMCWYRTLNSYCWYIWLPEFSALNSCWFCHVQVFTPNTKWDTSSNSDLIICCSLLWWWYYNWRLSCTCRHPDYNGFGRITKKQKNMAGCWEVCNFVKYNTVF